MKTPREILLTRHQSAVPKLDAIRHSTVAMVCDRRASANETHERRSQTAATIWQILWLELVWPCRRVWAGLAAVWVGILIVNFSQRDHSQMIATKSSSSPEMILSFRQQERLLTELIGSNEPRIAEPPKIVSPQPRSELRMEVFMT